MVSDEMMEMWRGNEWVHEYDTKGYREGTITPPPSYDFCVIESAMSGNSEAIIYI